MENDNLILIGMPGAGKSCIGVLLAKALGMSFIDSDIAIQEQKHRTLKQLIDEHGREGFLRIEGEVNAALEPVNCVIATGGSVVFSPEAMEHFNGIGTVVYLAIDCPALAERLGDLDERGVVHEPGQTIEDIYNARAGLYERYADVTVWQHEAVIDIPEVIGELTAALGRRGG